jgi:NAD(P)-dependent dehydrogenase (short-subunit alcohol dehydrogenase family)
VAKIEDELVNRVAVVTGGSRGIGAAIARKLASMGARVIVTGRDESALQTSVQQIQSAGGRGEAIVCDVTQLSSVEGLAAHIKKSAGRLDILVNNAGVMPAPAPLHELEPDEWERTIHTNLRGVFYCVRAFAPLMIDARGGDIVNISSIAGRNPLPNRAAYAASKWGLNGLSFSLAEELREHNIRVSVVSPGSTISELGWRGRDTSKMLHGEDIAQAVAMIVTQRPQAFASEVVIRPTQKP